MAGTLFQVHSSMPLDEFGSLWFRTEGPSPCWQAAGATLLPPGPQCSHQGPHMWNQQHTKPSSHWGSL